MPVSRWLSAISTNSPLSLSGEPDLTRAMALMMSLLTLMSSSMMAMSA
jgi:hypothetical protein